jgi:probable H4MPT-linked C1 transfer pathway protein
MLRHVRVKGREACTASELFAVTGDVYLLLGRITPDDYTCDTPDGGDKSPEGAARRIARLVCCDLSEMDNEDVREIALQVHRRQLDNLVDAVRTVAKRHGLTRAAICGLGAFLARDALGELEMPYAQVPDMRISKVFPAYAVACLLEEEKNVT